MNLRYFMFHLLINIHSFLFFRPAAAGTGDIMCLDVNKSKIIMALLQTGDSTGDCNEKKISLKGWLIFKNNVPQRKTGKDLHILPYT